MLEIESGRVTDPKTLSPIEVVNACAQREQLVVQFSRPEACSPAVLQSLNEASRLAQSRLQVRFFGHYGTRFDAAVLRALPEVRDLAVDCLSEIINEEEIGRLPNLTRLAFGVFEFNRPNFLDTIGLDRLTRLGLSETRTRNFDLSPLSRCEVLEDMFVHGHANGLEAIAKLPRLRKVTLSAYARKNGLSFIASIPNLEDFALFLGGRAEIDDLSSKSVKTLHIDRVRGLATLGDLARMPALASLRVEDQLQLLRLDLSGANLERLWLFNCRNLSELPALERQNQLREFVASRLALDLDSLRDRHWPISTRSVSLFSGSAKWNEDTEARLAARGLGEKRGLWP